MPPSRMYRKGNPFSAFFRAHIAYITYIIWKEISLAKNKKHSVGKSADKLLTLRKALNDGNLGDAVRIGGGFMNNPDWAKAALPIGKKIIELSDLGDTVALTTLYRFMDKSATFSKPFDGKFVWLMQLTSALENAKKYVVNYRLALISLDLLRETPPENLPARLLQHDVYFNYALAAFYMGDIAGAVDAFNEAWQMDDRVNIRARTFSNLLFSAQNLNFADEDLFAMHRSFNNFFADITPFSYDLENLRAEIKTRLAAGGKIRIGYISPDFREHVVMKFICGLFEFCDTDKFELYAYSLSQYPADDITAWIANRCRKFVNIAKLNHEDAAKTIHADKIDILADFAGHTANNPMMILAYKPAPVIITGVGYMSTTGLKTVDYIISDKIIEPPENGGKYLTEKPLYLTSHFSYSFYRDDPPASVGAPCAKKGFVTFGSFNKYNKLTDEMLSSWRDILRQTPNSRLLLKSFGFEEEDFAALIKERLARLGFDLTRVDIEGATQNFMMRYFDVDIALDTYPYTGGTTTCDALYMGVPVVSMYGERRNTRFGLGILTNMGLKSLATDNIEDYVAFAVNLAKDTALLNSLHRNLRRMFLNSPVGNAKNYAAEMQKKYMEILGLSVL